MVKPVNKILVSIPQAFEEEITTESGFKLYKDPSYQKEWNATVTGTVSALSDLVSEESRPVFNQLDLGMTVAFDYKIIADFEYVSDQDYFNEVTPEGSIHLRKFVNKRGFWINIRSVPNPKGVVAVRNFSVSGELATKATQEKTWVGWLQDRFMQIVDGVQGTEHDLERWLSQFHFGKTDKFYFKNKVFVNGKSEWVADYSQIIAKKIMGEWVALGDYAICRPLTVDVTQKVKLTAGGLHIPDSAIQMRFYDRGILLNGCEDMGIKKHEVIAFNEKYLYKNIIEGVEYFFIKKYHIDGIYPVN